MKLGKNWNMLNTKWKTTNNKKLKISFGRNSNLQIPWSSELTNHEQNTEKYPLTFRPMQWISLQLIKHWFWLNYGSNANRNKSIKHPTFFKIPNSLTLCNFR